MWLAGFDNRMRHWPSWYLPQNGFKGSTLPLCLLEALPSRKGQVLLIPSFLPWDSLTLSEVTMSPVTTKPSPTVRGQEISRSSARVPRELETGLGA